MQKAQGYCLGWERFGLCGECEESETMKKSIFIMMYYMNCGGVENALVDLLKHINPEKYEVHILFVEKRGEFLSKIPKWVKMSELQVTEVEKKLLLSLSIRDAIKKGIQTGKWIETIKISCEYLLCKLKKIPAPAYKTALLHKPSMKYDIALDFHGYLSLTTYFIAEKIEARKKYTWVHSEPVARKINSMWPYIKKYGNIFCVSQRCVDVVREELSRYDPGAVLLFKNFIDREEIYRLSRSGNRLKKKEEETLLLTVGRFSYQKGYDIAIQAAKNLKDHGISFKWYFCGDGELWDEINGKIKQHGLEKEIVLLGYQENPYGYMVSCDIYVQPSRYEGYAVTIVEASELGVPIISTDVSGAKEEIVDGKTGIVVPIDADALYGAISDLIEEPEKLMRMRTFAKNNKNIAEQTSQILLRSILE